MPNALSVTDARDAAAERWQSYVNDCSRDDGGRLDPENWWLNWAELHCTERGPNTWDHLCTLRDEYVGEVEWLQTVGR